MLPLKKVTGTDGKFNIIATDTHVCRAIEIMGRWERELLEYITPLICTDYTILDIGCNVGAHTIFYAKHSPQGQVMAFDVIPDFVKITQKNIRLNKFKNASAYNIGLSDIPGEITVPADLSEIFGKKEYNFGGLHLDSLQYSDTQHKTKKVKIITIDSLQLLKCDLIKIDVEEMEPQVLMGAVRTIDRFKPIIVFEAFRKTMQRCFDILHDYGYTDIQCPTSNPADFVALK
ncbi:MAG: FkbM family methyltransferase [Mariniphaga sp.]|nr:FkbM family methyltransferase [Mariniphaga sp.]